MIGYLSTVGRRQVSTLNLSPYEQCQQDTAGQEWLVDPCVQFLPGGPLSQAGCSAPNVWTNRGCVPPSLPPVTYSNGGPVPAVIPPSSVFPTTSADLFDKLRDFVALVKAHPYLFGAGAVVLVYLIYSSFIKKGKR